jgi:glycosyltransferase involved in cell wall biosynthesis
MRIAQIAPLHEAVPPKLYGGTERVVAYLTDALVDLGHDVTLFASGDSHTKATLEAGWPRALRLDPSTRDVLAPHMMLLETVRRVAHDFDVLHFHLDYLPFSLFSEIDVPFVTTLHGRLDLPELQPIFDAFSNAPVISISNSQRVPLPQANWVSTIYHGLPPDLLKPQTRGQLEYLAFLGRICPEKRPDLAVQIAAQSGLPLKIAAKVDEADRQYFKNTFAPLLSQPHVEFLGEINEQQKSEFLSGAKALLFPIDWSEPFGLVMIEAMACGTPVIAFNRGAVPEVIDHGVTGFICEDVQDAVGALQRLDRLPRPEIRAQFERRFSANTMALNYVDSYTSLLRATRCSVSRRATAGRSAPGRRSTTDTGGWIAVNGVDDPLVGVADRVSATGLADDAQPET